ncbi:uncharacterized protein [Rutidosis leptorrhynchoides]|uniref:uncharacterized protein n=1 Tax=Rutidosis leptorrhynchoides TaxID=125765 RepID=UPI003A99590B
MNCNEKFNKRSSRKDSEIDKSVLAYKKKWFDELKKKNAMDENFEWFIRKHIQKYGYEENDDDPQYVQFLKNLSVNGKSYKLAIYKNNEFSHFIKYEEREEEEDDEELDGYDPLTCEFDINGDKGDNGEFKEKVNEKEVDIPEASRKNENNKDVNSESGYQMALNGYAPDNDGGYELKLDGINVTYENKPSTSYDSDIQILENITDVDEVEVRKSLKEKLLPILRKPYSSKEYKELLVYLEKKKPICRNIPLRTRDISSAMKKEGKSLLDDAPGRVRKKVAAAKKQRDWPTTLNLMRMYRFWLENPDGNDVFKPWSDKDCLSVLPLQHTK